MSDIAGLYNVPSNIAELNTWAFAHAAHHRDINRTIYQLTGTSLIENILDPLNPQDLGVWLYQHQQMHDQFESVLGIAGYDLLDVDWENQNELAGWILLNASSHQQAANILNIG